ncbi:hypothetical protein SDC9_185232 [bioreactor metagenome]|uniref:Uncharacterized protein n=1 Tax=bioreactor metagenome TaxID=1076179 RepID=A0A645HH50_9ZZZZ
MQRFFMGPLFFLPIAGQAQDGLPQGVARSIVQPNLHVVFHRKGFKKPDVLEGSGNAHLIELVGLFARRILAIQQDGAAGRGIYVGDQVKHSGFARTVGTNQAGNFRATDGKVEIVHGAQTAEINAQMPDIQNGELTNIPFGNKSRAGNTNQFIHWNHLPSLLSFPPAAGRR